MEEFVSTSEKETLEFARMFAKTLAAGDIVLLDGDLGAGKTVFSKGVVDELSGGKELAVSPTFVIVNVYNANPPVYHFDLYRINDPAELEVIGANEYFYSNGVSLVEWPARAEGVFPDYAIKVYIEKLSDKKRLIRVER